MTSTTREGAPAPLDVRLLGPIEVFRHGAREDLPRSKKTRALLAYLVASGSSHHRDRLCALLWDVTDDPRGALRWSLSKLRQVVDDDVSRIEADRERVAFLTAGARVDVTELLAAARGGVGGLPTEELERLAGLVRGEFLEGFELPDFFEFQAWCISMREQAREARCDILAELVGRTREEPRRALGYARARAEADPFSVAARIEFLEVLALAGRTEEAQQQLDVTRRLFREVGAPGLAEIEKAWRETASGAVAPRSRPVIELPPRAGRPLAPVTHAFVGRSRERARLAAMLEDTRSRGQEQIMLVTGEPGSGKSRLAAELVSQARASGSEVLEGRAYEAESSRPFGPWMDALRTEITQLVPDGTPEQPPATREGLFAAVAEATGTRAAQGNGALLVLDDIQWLDRDSAELLHFVARTNRNRPLMVLLLARGGELADNEAALRALRSLRREDQVEEIALGALSRAEIDELVAFQPIANGKAIYEASAGNPLYALELARAIEANAEPSPVTIHQLVRERIDRLPPQAAEVLRWCSVLGHTIDVSRLQSLSSLELDELVNALERLEEHALLRADEATSGERYVFAHDVVREAVYGELSHPRRRLMHQRVALLLEPGTADATTATEVARHASLAGEAMLGIRACVVAGLRSLRVFANGDAEALALRGLELVGSLAEADRIASTLDLLHIRYSARTPDREAAAAQLLTLAEQALDLGLTNAARLGFQMLSFLRWESSSMAAAHDNIMQAERLSRLAGPEERTMALGQAAKCLVLLERNMEQAEAFILEAGMLAGRGARAASAVPFARGMIHEHRGEYREAKEAFVEARRLGREDGDRLAEFAALEHEVMLEIDRGDYEAASELADRLVELGERVRQGAEAPSSRALKALCRNLCGDGDHRADLETALDGLRAADAKYELAYLLTRQARLEMDAGDHQRARTLAEEALEAATAIGRASEVARCRVLLMQIARRAEDEETAASQLEALRNLPLRELASAARGQVEALIS